MNLLTETLIISGGMSALATLPLYSDALRRHSKLFFLLGTGALSGILAFDLLPDLFELGGMTSLWGAGAVWALYSLLHLTHLGHHHGQHPDSGSPLLFLASMISHCLASGALLVASQGLTPAFNHTVFWALLSHKGYEALTVSSVLLEKQSSRSRAVLSIVLYALSLPVGVALTYRFREVLTPSVALIATSLAAGTLMGCLIHDFLIPSFAHLRGRRANVVWIAAGLLLTQLVMRAF